MNRIVLPLSPYPEALVDSGLTFEAHGLQFESTLDELESTDT